MGKGKISGCLFNWIKKGLKKGLQNGSRLKLKRAILPGGEKIPRKTEEILTGERLSFASAVSGAEMVRP